MVPASWHWPFSKLNLSKALAHMFGESTLLLFASCLSYLMSPLRSIVGTWLSTHPSSPGSVTIVNLSLRFIPGVMKNSRPIFSCPHRERVVQSNCQRMTDRSTGILKIFLNWWLDLLLNPRSHFSNFSLETMICVCVCLSSSGNSPLTSCHPDATSDFLDASSWLKASGTCWKISLKKLTSSP